MLSTTAAAGGAVQLERTLSAAERHALAEKRRLAERESAMATELEAVQQQIMQLRDSLSVHSAGIC